MSQDIFVSLRDFDGQKEPFCLILQQLSLLDHPMKSSTQLLATVFAIYDWFECLEASSNRTPNELASQPAETQMFFCL